ncbi:MAG: hypothetical protein R2744_08605 [Bacteroidales bacterium]
MEFKKLELDQDRSWFRRVTGSRQFRRSISAVLIGAIAGFLYYYFTEGKELVIIPFGDIFKSVVIGGFFGFFITNSPCARGRC